MASFLRCSKHLLADGECCDSYPRITPPSINLGPPWLPTHGGPFSSGQGTRSRARRRSKRSLLSCVLATDAIWSVPNPIPPRCWKRSRTHSCCRSGRHERNGTSPRPLAGAIFAIGAGRFLGWHLGKKEPGGGSASGPIKFRQPVPRTAPLRHQLAFRCQATAQSHSTARRCRRRPARYR